MKIWVDADSCPAKIRNIVTRACLREEITGIFVANRAIPVDEHEYIEKVITEQRDQSADEYIMEKVSVEDLVITRDIPLADELVTKGVLVLNDRGVVYTEENIKERLSIRDYMKEMRDLGLGYESTDKFNNKDVQKFANAFDKELRIKISQISK